MFTDVEIKNITDEGITNQEDEVLWCDARLLDKIREISLSKKESKKDDTICDELLLSDSSRNDLEMTRSLLREGFFSEPIDNKQARFVWSEEDDIASLVSEPGFGTTGQTTFSRDMDLALRTEMKEADTSCGSALAQPSRSTTLAKLSHPDSHIVSSTSNTALKTQGPCKVGKADPRSKLHYVKYVKRHGRIVKLWECGICGREFQHQYTLMRHLPTHTDERNFRCDACGKSFRQLSTLSQHKAIHSSERPYSCEVCNKTFNRVSTLISHRKTHSNVKPYRCHMCPKGFHQKGNLRNHLFTHTNERPYRCSICYKGFNQQSNLVCHKNKAHPEENSNCVDEEKNLFLITRPETKPDSTRSSSEQCEVTSSVGPIISSFTPDLEIPSTSHWAPRTETIDWGISQNLNTEIANWNPECRNWVSGVIVDPIKTYHMSVALATKQTPFALLTPYNGTPVVVKVIDTQLPGGKQMLVPATAEDLKIGGKIIVQNDDSANQRGDANIDENMSSAIQIRVPVVANVVPKINSGGKLDLKVEAPHHEYHTALSADVAEIKVESITVEEEGAITPLSPIPSTFTTDNHPSVKFSSDHVVTSLMQDRPSLTTEPGAGPSPSLDFISMDFFKPIIDSPYNTDQSPPSGDDPDIFIEKHPIHRF